MLGPGPNPFQSTYRHKSFTRAQTHTLCSVDFPLITLQVLPPTMGGWKDPASPCRHLPCTAVGSSAQSPKTPSIMLERAAGASTAVPGQSFLQTQSTVGLLILQPPTPPASLFPVSVGETAAVGERMGVGKSRERGRSIGDLGGLGSNRRIFCHLWPPPHPQNPWGFVMSFLPPS